MIQTKYTVWISTLTRTTWWPHNLHDVRICKVDIWRAWAERSRSGTRRSLSGCAWRRTWSTAEIFQSTIWASWRVWRRSRRGTSILLAIQIFWATPTGPSRSIEPISRTFTNWSSSFGARHPPSWRSCAFPPSTNTATRMKKAKRERPMVRRRSDPQYFLFLLYPHPTSTDTLIHMLNFGGLCLEWKLKCRHF